MNAKKQRIAIAKHCEWTDIRTVLDDDPDEFGIDLVGKRNGGRDYVPLPDYLNDLNAMHEAENALTFESKLHFFRNLRKVKASRLNLSDPSDMATRELIFATAAQRAEAFLRTIGKWEDE